MNGIYVYVVRWAIDGGAENDGGNADVCYEDERKAEGMLLADFASVRGEWEGAGKKRVTAFLSMGDNGIVDYARINVDTEDGRRVYRWWIDKVEVGD